jgi:hypothetical protein
MQKVIFYKIRTIAAILFCLLLSACAPTLYKQPATNFKDATNAAQTIYFSQLESTHESFIFGREINLKLDILLDGAYDFESKEYLDEKKKISNLEKATPILKKSLRIRQNAFRSLDYYAQVLIALASDENVDSLKTEISGFASDLAGLSEKISELSDINASLEFLGPVADWANPLASAAKILNGVIDIVTDYLREEAIKKAIVEADPMVQELLTLLQKEAVNAVSFQKKNYQEAVRGCSEAVTQSKPAQSAARYLAHEICFSAELRLNQVPKEKDVADAMKLVRVSHSELKKLAEGGDYKTIAKRIEKFYRQVMMLKEQIQFFTDK